MSKRCKDGFVAGDPYVICDICGFRNRYSKTVMMYNHMRVCADVCYDPKPLQEYPIPFPKNELRSFPNARPEADDTYIDMTLPPDITDLHT